MKDARRLGRRLRELRIQAQLSQHQLAEKINVHFSYLSKIENGVLPPPSDKVIFKLAEALNADKEQLVMLSGRISSGIARTLRSRAISEFGPKLRELRIRAGMSQRVLAEEVGIDATYLSKLENGKMPPPSKKVIPQMAKALNVGKGELMALAGRVPSVSKRGEALRMLKHFSRLPNLPILPKSLPKISVPNKSWARVAISVVLVIALGASLWFASPQPAKAIDITFPSTPNGNVVSTHTFTVKVEVRDTDLLPIRKIDLQFNKVGSSTYLVNCTNLPLPVSPGTVGPSLYTTSAGTVSISGEAGANWVYATSAGRQGYGYGYTTGTWDTQTFPTGYGYGYGYNTNYVGTTLITYTVTWTPPSSSWQGTYNVEVVVYGNGASTALTNETPGSFTINPQTVTPTVTGEGSERPSPTTEDVSDIVDEDGVFTSLARIESGDGNVNLFIPKGTTGKIDGEPLSKITIRKVSPPDPPPDANFIGLTYDLEPSGATFDPEISLTFTYNPAWIPPRADPENLTIAYYDEDAGRWVELDAEDITIDPERNTISCDISHFTYFSVIVYTRPADITLSALTISPSTVDIAKSVQISVTITNTGDLAGSHEVTLKINNVAVSTKKVTLDGHATEKVTFTSVQGAPGTYTVSINGITGAFTVKPAPVGPVVITQPLWTAPPAPPPAAAPPAPVLPPAPAPVAPLPVNWLIVGIFAAVAVIVVGIVVWVFGFRSQY